MNVFDEKIVVHHSFNDFSVICCVSVLVWEKELHCERAGIFWRLYKSSCWTDRQHHFCLQNWRRMVKKSLTHRVLSPPTLQKQKISTIMLAIPKDYINGI